MQYYDATMIDMSTVMMSLNLQQSQFETRQTLDQKSERSYYF